MGFLSGPSAVFASPPPPLLCSFLALLSALSGTCQVEARSTTDRSAAERTILLHITDSLLLYVTVALNPLTYRTVL